MRNENEKKLASSTGTGTAYQKMKTKTKSVELYKEEGILHRRNCNEYKPEKQSMNKRAYNIL